jgi:hypothetical protein
MSHTEGFQSFDAPREIFPADSRPTTPSGLKPIDTASMGVVSQAVDRDTSRGQQSWGDLEDMTEPPAANSEPGREELPIEPVQTGPAQLGQIGLTEVVGQQADHSTAERALRVGDLVRAPRQIQDAAGYREAFERGEPVEIPENSGLRGRILRGRETQPEEFDNLGLPGRELVFIMGPDGLSELPGRPLPVALEHIGLTPDYVAGRIAQGYSFKLVVFEGGAEAPLATWDNALSLIVERHPALAPDIEAHRQALRETPFQEFAERMLPDDLDQIELAGPSHPAFMTTERYLELPPELRRTDPLYLRRWLLHTEHLGTLFSGDGYVQTPDGERGLKEYLVPNVPLADLQGIEIIDLPWEGGAHS